MPTVSSSEYLGRTRRNPKGNRMKTLLVIAALVFSFPAFAQQSYQEQRMMDNLQQQMRDGQRQQEEQQERIRDQAQQMRAGGCWYNRSQPYC
jgi:uncharacterized membrane protein (DUF106 family)